MTKTANENKSKTIIGPDEIIKAEKEYIGIAEGQNGSGLAISGGGIRSASFGLGVMQALVANNQLSKMDYMSTVSGGGYLGAALTWALKQEGANVGTTPETFPLGKKRKPGSKKEVNKDQVKQEDGNERLNFIRQHGSYLMPTSKLDIISFFAVLIRSITISLFFYLSLLTVVMTGSLWIGYRLALKLPTDLISFLKDQSRGIINLEKGQGLLLLPGILIICIFMLMLFIYSFGTFANSMKTNKGRYRKFIRGQIHIGVILKLGLACLLLGTLPFVASFIHTTVNKALATGLPTLFGTVVGIWQYGKARKNDKNTATSSDTIIYAGAFALFYGVFLFAYIFATSVFLDPLQNFDFDYPVAYIIVVLLTILIGLLVNLNLIGPNYVYRNRLMETFMPNKNAVKNNTWEAATEADGELMENMCDEPHQRPYHIINTNAILSNSKQVAYSGRGGDNFIISRLYCGSKATGWKTTKTFHKNYAKGITLASAMAASAAALNPYAGVSGVGVTRNTVVSLLLSMLNLRLGYWTSNPGGEDTMGPPNFFIPGLSSEIFRNGFEEKDKNLLLSDGGHYENLAIYELIRRKLELIVLSDGGCDPGFNFDDLANAIEKARVDFDARINFRDGYKADDILPGTSGETAFQTKYLISKHGFAIADIFYNDDSQGTLVYIKLAMIEGLPTDVYSYKGINPLFPHQSTGDQAFDETQFEAYRELGYYTAWQAMNSREGRKIFPKETAAV